MGAEERTFPNRTFYLPLSLTSSYKSVREAFEDGMAAQSRTVPENARIMELEVLASPSVAITIKDASDAISEITHATDSTDAYIISSLDAEGWQIKSGSTSTPLAYVRMSAKSG